MSANECTECGKVVSERNGDGNCAACAAHIEKKRIYRLKSPKVDDVIVLDDQGKKRAWQVVGVYLGGVNQEDIVEMYPLDKYESHQGNAKVPVEMLVASRAEVRRIGCANYYRRLSLEEQERRMNAKDALIKPNLCVCGKDQEE